MSRALTWFAGIEPERRRKLAFLILVVSFVLGHVNIGLFMFGVIPEAVMGAITNYLSWLALTITALDVLMTSDVRVQQED